MTLHTPRTFAALFVVAVLACPLANAGAPPDVVGTWDALASTPEGDMPGTMTISEKDGALEVEMTLAGLSRSVTDEKLEGNVLTMTVHYDGVPYDVELTVDGDTMEGTYTGSVAAGPLTATRQE